MKTLLAIIAALAIAGCTDSQHNGPVPHIGQTMSRDYTQVMLIQETPEFTKYYIHMQGGGDRHFAYFITVDREDKITSVYRDH